MDYMYLVLRPTLETNRDNFRLPLNYLHFVWAILQPRDSWTLLYPTEKGTRAYRITQPSEKMSGSFVNPGTLMYLTPVLSTTCTLWLAHDQWFFLRIFTDSRVRKRSSSHEELLRAYFDVLFKNGAPLLVGMLFVTLGSTSAVLWSSSAVLEASGAWWWYAASGALAVSHLAYAPLVFPLVHKITAKDGSGKNVEGLKAWMRIHILRSLTADLGAWTCCLIAASKMLICPLV